MGFNLDTFEYEEDLPEQEPEKDEFERVKSKSPFDYIESITNGRTNIMVTENDVKAYQPFVVNRGLAMGVDTLFYANEMNVNYHLPKDLQYHYLRHSVKKGKRYNKWAKEIKIDDINTICEYYGVNRKRAMEYLNILTKQQLKIIYDQIARSEGRVFRGKNE